MKTLIHLNHSFFLLAGLIALIITGCSKDDSSSEQSQESFSAPQSIVGKSLIWKHNGYNDDTYTFNFDGTVAVKSIVNSALNATISNSSYIYTPYGDGSASLQVKYTSTFYTGTIKSVIPLDVDFVFTFYKEDSGVYSAHETSKQLGTTKKTGPFLLGKVGDLIKDDSFPIVGNTNCEQRQYIYNSMRKNLESTERLRNSAGSASVRIAAGNLIVQIKQNMEKAKTDAKKVGCTLQ